MECAFCDGRTAYLEEYGLPRHELIKVLREKEGLGQYELAALSDYYEKGIQAMERGPEELERAFVEDVQDLVVPLKVPLQILLAVKCSKCGR